MPDVIENDLSDGEKTEEPYEEVVELKPDLINEEQEKNEPQEDKEDIFVDENNKPKKLKKKRVLSEEHKEKLALARVKALETRRAKSKDKKELKDLESRKIQKDIEDKKRKLKEELGETPKIVKFNIEDLEEPIEEKNKILIDEIPKSIDNKKTFNITDEDIKKLQMDAIINYDTLRKNRKVEKNKIKIIEKEKEIIHKKLERAMNSNYNSGYFDNCF